MEQLYSMTWRESSDWSSYLLNPLSPVEEYARDALHIRDKTTPTTWDKLVKKIETIELRVNEDLKNLRDKSLPNSVHEAIQNVKKIYGYKKYMIDGKSATFDGITVIWDKQTGVSDILVHLKSWTRDIELDIRHSLYTDMSGSPQPYQMRRKGNNSLVILTSSDAQKSEKPQEERIGVRTPVKRSTPNKSSAQAVMSDARPQANTMNDEFEKSRYILLISFPNFKRSIDNIDVTKVYGKKSPDWEYEMVFDIKDSPWLIVRKNQKGTYEIGVNQNGHMDQHAKEIITIWTQEKQIKLNQEEGQSISLPPSERQSFIDSFPGRGFSFHPNTNTALLWKSETITIPQAKAIAWFHEKEFDFGGYHPRQQLIATKKKNSADLWLQRADSKDYNYFVIIVKENGEVVASIKRNVWTSIISTTATPEENAIIERIRKSVKKPFYNK